MTKLLNLLVLFIVPMLVSSMGGSNIFGVVRKRLDFMRLVQEHRYAQAKAQGLDFKEAMGLSQRAAKQHTKSS